MSLLSDLNSIMTTSKIPCEVGVFTKTPAPATFVVLDPLGDMFHCADDTPETEVQSVRISLYTKTNYTTVARNIAKAVIAAGHTITDRRYIAHDDDTGYYHYAIDVDENYEWENN